MLGFVKYVKHIYYNHIVKRVQYQTAILACTTVSVPSTINHQLYTEIDMLKLFILTFLYIHIL